MSEEKKLPLSVAIITLTEERNLPRCLESVRKLASEIVVVDSNSTDGTHAVAERFGAMFEVHPWQGQIAQCRVALSRCTQPWVLCLDADEALSPELAASIRKVFSNGEPAVNGFAINRRTFYLGRWIEHVWYPEWRLRLARRNVAEWIGREPHYVLSVSGATARLDGETRHDRGGHRLLSTDRFFKRAFAPIEITVEARDNDPLLGPKWGKSEVITIVPPVVGEPEAMRYEAVARARDALVDTDRQLWNSTAARIHPRLQRCCLRAFWPTKSAKSS